MKTFLCSHLVILKTRDREIGANLERISCALATVNAEEQLAVGAAVTLDTGAFDLVGTVVRCSLEVSGYEIEVALQPEWSLEAFVPDHLFDPDVMIAR
jgi:hypothetical protein